MTKNELRNVALLMQGKLRELYAAIAPAYAEANGWQLNLSDAKLPTIAQVKAALLAYEAISKPPLSMFDELRELKSATDTAAPLPEGVVSSVAWGNVTDKPTTYPPATHGHAELSPATHPHVKADISDFPATLPGRVEVVEWVGNGTANRAISLSGQFTPRFGLAEIVGYNQMAICIPGVHWSNVTAASVTIDAGINGGYSFRMIVME